MNEYSIALTIKGRQHLAAITAPTFVSSSAFMFANKPAANIVVYSAYGTTRAAVIFPITGAPHACITKGIAADETNCAPDTTVGSGMAATASLFTTSIDDEHREYTPIATSFSPSVDDCDDCDASFFIFAVGVVRPARAPPRCCRRCRRLPPAPMFLRCCRGMTMTMQARAIDDDALLQMDKMHPIFRHKKRRCK